MAHRFLVTSGMAALLAAAVVWAGCGGTDAPSIAGDGGSGDGASPSSSSSGSSSTNSGSSGGGSGSGTSSSGSGSGSTSGSSGGSGSTSSSSGSGSSSGSSSGSGSTSGSSSGSSSSSGGTGINCPTTPCPAGQTCCADVQAQTATCSSSCPAADTLGCITPSDCTGGTYCCATVVLNGGTIPNCTTQSVSTQCGSCVSNIQASCTANDTFRECTTGADCATDTNDPNCCDLQARHVCVSNFVKQFGGATNCN